VTAKELGKTRCKSQKRIENQLTLIYGKLYIEGKQNEKKATLLKISQWFNNYKDNNYKDCNFRKDLDLYYRFSEK